MAEETISMEFIVDEKDFGFWTKTAEYVSSKYSDYICKPRATGFKIVELLMSFFLMNMADLPLEISGDLIFLILTLHTSLARYKLSLTYNSEPSEFEENENTLYIVQAFADALSMPIFDLECAQKTQECCNYLLSFLSNKTGKSAKRIVMERIRQITENPESSSSSSSSSSSISSLSSSDTMVTTSESDTLDE
jgi:hypothetical protein